MKDFIKIKNLVLVSNKGVRNLIDIPNLQFDSESISVIIGPNGAGKSLLLNLIQGLIKHRYKVYSIDDYSSGVSGNESKGVEYIKMDIMKKLMILGTLM